MYIEGFSAFAGGKKKKKKKKSDKVQLAKIAAQSQQFAMANQTLRQANAIQVPLADINQSAATDRVDIKESGLTDRTDIGEGNLTQRTDILTSGAVNLQDIRSGERTDVEDIRANRDIALQGDKAQLTQLEIDRLDTVQQHQLDLMQQKADIESDQRDAAFEREQYYKELERADREALVDPYTDIESNAYEAYSDEPSTFAAIMPLIDPSYAGMTDPFGAASTVQVKPRPLHQSGTAATPQRILAGVIQYDAQGRPVKTMLGRRLTRQQMIDIRQAQITKAAIAKRNAALRRRAMMTPVGSPLSSSSGFSAALVASGAVTNLGTLGGIRKARAACCGNCEGGGRCDSDHRSPPQIVQQLINSQQPENQGFRPRRGNRRCNPMGGCAIPSADPLPWQVVDPGIIRGRCSFGKCGDDQIGFSSYGGMRSLPPLRTSRAFTTLRGRCEQGNCVADLASRLRRGRCASGIIRGLSNVVAAHRDSAPQQQFVYRVVRRVSPLLDV